MEAVRRLAAVVDIRGPSVEITGCCDERLAVPTARAVQQIVRATFAEELAQNPDLLRRLCARVAER